MFETLSASGTIISSRHFLVSSIDLLCGLHSFQTATKYFTSWAEYRIYTFLTFDIIIASIKTRATFHLSIHRITKIMTKCSSNETKQKKYQRKLLTHFQEDQIRIKLNSKRQVSSLQKSLGDGGITSGLFHFLFGLNLFLIDRQINYRAHQLKQLLSVSQFCAFSLVFDVATSGLLFTLSTCKFFPTSKTVAQRRNINIESKY